MVSQVRGGRGQAYRPEGLPGALFRWARSRRGRGSFLPRCQPHRPTEAFEGLFATPFRSIKPVLEIGKSNIFRNTSDIDLHCFHKTFPLTGGLKVHCLTWNLVKSQVNFAIGKLVWKEKQTIFVFGISLQGLLAKTEFCTMLRDS